MKKEKAVNFLKIPVNRIIALVLMDIMSIIVASFAALYVRFDFSFSAIYEEFLLKFEHILIPNILVTLLFFTLWKLYKSVWRYASANELINIVFATACTTAAQVIYCHLFHQEMPRSYYILYWFILMLETCCIRFGYRILRLINSKRAEAAGKENRINVMVIGAGEAGNMILKEIESSRYLNLQAKCIIDDQPGCHGKMLRGIPIIGGRDKILEAVPHYGIDEIIFAIPSANVQTKKEILDICKESGCKLRTLPGMYQLINGEVSVSKLKEVEIEDLLGREPICINVAEVLDYLSGKTVLVTGGGGSIGSELCRQIAGHHPKRLIIVDIYENNAYEIQQELIRKYPELDLVVLIASVRNTSRINDIFATYRPDVVYHAAAHKHVPLMEFNPEEAVKNNIFGTKNVAELSNQYGVERFLLISTDKAVNPTNVMGATKRFTEMLIQMLNKQGKTRFVAVRFGNVIGSNGSVIPLFQQQLAKGGPLTVTHKDIIRYFMTIPEAVQLVLEAGSMAKGGEIFILDMGQPVRILDVAEKMIRLSGLEPYKDIDIQFVGLRPGEKLYEELRMSEEGTLSTQNSKIFIATITAVADEVLQQSLVDLKKALDAQNEEKLVKTLQQAVPTYHPQMQYHHGTEKVPASNAKIVQMPEAGTVGA